MFDKENEKRNWYLCGTCFFLAFLLLLGTYRQESEVFAERIAPKLLRFHVLANSNSTEDQSLKLLVRTKLLDSIYENLEEDASLEETRLYIAAHETELTRETETYIRELGYDYPVAMELTDCYFPTKAYGDMIFPCGTYHALRVEIGKGKGHNWWCVLYPRLCFVDAAYAAVPDPSRDLLLDSLGKPDYDRLFLPSRLRLEVSRPSETKVNIRFKALDFLQKRGFDKK